MESGSSSFQLRTVRIAMKMFAVSEITLLLFCCSIISSADSKDQCSQYATKGKDFMVALDYNLKDTEKLRWKHKDITILGRKPVENGKLWTDPTNFNPGSNNDIYQNGSLKLTKVDHSKSGKYTPEVFKQDGTPAKEFQPIMLCVLDPVPKPEVKIECLKDGVKFTCSFGQAKGLTIEWFQNDKKMAEKGSILKQPIKVETDSYSCKVSNLANFMTSGRVTHTCSPKSILNAEIMGLSIWVFVGGGGGVVLVLIVIVIVCCVRAKRKKRMHLKDEQELRLCWNDPEQRPQQPQHHHPHPHRHPQQHNHTPNQHHHHHQQQQPAGHTGPRQPRAKQQREKQQRPRAPEPPGNHPQPSPRRSAQTPKPAVNNDDEQPPPLPQPRKKAPKTPRM